jgi:hypothetical protein
MRNKLDILKLDNKAKAVYKMDIQLLVPQQGFQR